MKDFEEFLQHHGVKGMKWGVIRKRASSGQNGSKKSKKPGRLKEEWDSLKRERSWKKIDTSRMSTKDLKNVAKRVTSENELKRLSRSPVGSAKDKKDYRKRAKMSDQELNRKLERLRAKDQLQKQASQASKAQMEFGKKLVDAAAPFVIGAILGTPSQASQRRKYNEELRKAGFTRR